MSNENHRLSLTPDDALIIVDLQKDFLSGGPLEVPEGDAVIPVLNQYLDIFQNQDLPIYATRDWHPSNHCSFKEFGGPWPVHCVAESEGAEFADKLELPANAKIISSATLPDKEAYSGFEGTDLDAQLKESGVKRLFVGGLATDYCVFHTVKDALQFGYQVYLLEDAVRAVNVKPADGQQALDEMIRQGSQPCALEAFRSRNVTSALSTDLYQLTMMQGYFDRGMAGTAVFEFFVRRLPPGRDFLISAGLEQVLAYLETMRFTEPDLEWMAEAGHFSREFVDSLKGFRFTGEITAMPEGTIFFAEEPVLRVTAPLPEAQLVETQIINLLQYQTLIASKAARIVLAAPGKVLMDFGLRRAHSIEAGLLAARASFLAGFTGTATVQASREFGIPVFGTMAHSYIQAHEDETKAFEHFARSHPNNVVLLLDTYDTQKAAHKVTALATKLKKHGIAIKGVRIDSGDLLKSARQVRAILDAGGGQDIGIFGSGNLDESSIRRLESENAPYDGYGIGTRLTTSQDAASLDCVYKMQEYEGRALRKRSEKKATWPGRKQVFRAYDEKGRMREDRLTLESEISEGQALLVPVMRGGRRLNPPAPLKKIREHAAQELDRLPDSLRELDATHPYPVTISPSIKKLAETVDHKQRAQEHAPGNRSTAHGFRR